MPHLSKTTTDHDIIRKWTEERGGRPAVIAGTENEDSGAGTLRIDFPEIIHEESLKEISWDLFFDTFDEKNLAFLYQENTSDGEISRFNKFVDNGEPEEE